MGLTHKWCGEVLGLTCVLVGAIQSKEVADYGVVP